MHHIYHTEGFVLEGRASGEANKYFTIFTRDLGLIRASAQGVRLLKSKHRFSLREYSLISLSVVRGKEWWRIASASENKNFAEFRKNKSAFILYVRILSLFRRLIHGEEKNEKLFNLLSEIIGFLEENKLTSKDLENFECLAVLRILSNLGYAPKLAKLSQFFVDNVWNTEILAEMNKVRGEAVREINQALKETHL